MSIEALLSDLTAAIRANTASFDQLRAELLNIQANAGSVAAEGAEATPAKRGRKPKAEVTTTAPVTGDTPAPSAALADIPSLTQPAAPAPADNEVAGKSDGDRPASAEVDMAHYRATVKQELLAYRDAVRDIQPASIDPGEAVKVATVAARDLLALFKAAKFDDIKDGDLEALRAKIAEASAALTEQPAGDDDLLGDL